MSDADQTIGTSRGSIEASANTIAYSNVNFNAQTTSAIATSAAQSQFAIMVLNSTYSFRGNTEAIFYGGLAAATAVSYQLVEG